MVILSYCPGPGWVRVDVNYVICAITGALVVPAAGESFWTRAI